MDKISHENMGCVPFDPLHHVAETPVVRSPAASGSLGACVKELKSEILSLKASQSTLTGRFQSVCKSLADVVLFSISGADSQEVLRQVMDILGLLRHYDDSLLRAWRALMRVGSTDTAYTRIQVAAARRFSLSVTPRVGVTEIASPPNPDAGLIVALAAENKKLLYEIDELRMAVIPPAGDPQLETVMNKLLSFEYVAVRIFILRPSVDHPSFPVPEGGMFISLNGAQSSSVSFDGNWKGETLVLPFTESAEVTVEVSRGNGRTVAKSQPLKLAALIADTVQVPLGDKWTLSMGVIFGLSPATVASALNG